MPDVQAAVDELAAALAHAVLIEDPKHRPLWWSAQGEVDGTRMRTIMQREVRPAARDVVVRFGLARAKGPTRTPAVPEAEMLARWCVPLRSPGELLGYLWVLNGDGKVTEDDLPRIVACADLAATALAQPRAQGQRRAALLARLETGPDPDAVHELVALEGLDPTSTVVVQGPRTVLRKAMGGWPLRDGLSAHVDPSPKQVATSGAPLPLGELHVAVRRATATLQAIRAGAVLDRPSWDALGAWHLVVAAPPELAVGDIHPGAEVLAGQPRPDLMVTARAVLEHGGDVALTAAELHIHRTTLYYRLDRIQALIGVNLRSGTGREDLQMALRLAAYRLAGR